ncbi:MULTISPECIES: long-chain-fatty-acid--CoA ligase [Comamonas]|uniref:LuxE/PaaK family acyltransferase n=1 Tax=Comamonas TaxID=283 RepID=UPI0006224202|nr:MULTISPECIES: long-chain-fatty-acid--CoA ligase [Comamonas]KKI12714.1 long-chain fatty acid--CoA ligase [Comamonas thiooxydans]TYK77621.1 long-chain fatty acid--CoA ligase [Comamonas sp. Z1]BCX53290.1 coenzyme F390 synthetase [Comamonas testosteroni]
MDKAASLVADLLAFIAMDDCTDDQFNQLALRLFAYQYECNAPFRSFCQRRGATLRNVRSWRDVPAVPIDAFKAMELRSEPPSPAERVFMTSGTTGRAARGRHFHPRLDVYDLSMKRYFARRFMQGLERMPMGILFPDEQAMPNSSLAHYLALARSEFGSAGSRYYLNSEGLDMQALCAALAESERSGQPFALLGASFSLVHVMDALRAQDRSFRLPAGSRVLDTGGYKGQSRELPLEQFYAELSQLLGVPRSLCINMYGMTELSTQFYDDGNAVLPSVKSGPHWIRSRLVEPITGRDVAAGERGILVHCDLANYNAVTTILTEDVGLWAGQQEKDGFLLLGRAEGAAAKGCSLAVEEFVKAAGA